MPDGVLNFDTPQDAMRMERDGNAFKVYAKEGSGAEVCVCTFRGQGDRVDHDISANNPGFTLTPSGRVYGIDG